MTLKWPNGSHCLAATKNIVFFFLNNHVTSSFFDESIQFFLLKIDFKKMAILSLIFVHTRRFIHLIVNNTADDWI